MGESTRPAYRRTRNISTVVHLLRDIETGDVEEIVPETVDPT
jgi:hypothetical protein